MTDNTQEPQVQENKEAVVKDTVSGAMDEITKQVEEQNEKDILLKRAATLGLRVSGNIGLETLRQRVKDALEGKASEPEKQEEVKTPEGESYAQKLKRMRETHLALVRVRISCMNPHKSEITGEVITVANKYLGTIRKMVPFGDATANGYHIPRIIYEELKRRKFQSIKTVRRNGVDVIIPESLRDLPEFNIEVLPPLTEKELYDLKIMQAQSGSTLGE